MVFSSLTFLFYFLPIFFVVYAAIPAKWKNYWLLTGSVVFYAWGAPKFVFILLASTIIDYYVVRQLYRARNKLSKRKWLATSISLNLGLLAYFKYANFFVENVNTLLTTLNVGSMPWIEVALPIGISFYTFQTLTYSIDIYREQQKPLDKVSDYVLYIMMFPQLIAGPIVRFGDIAGQIVKRSWGSQQIVQGFIRFSIGLGKKVLIANTLASTADSIMAIAVDDLTSSVAWVGILCYTFQIYFDFAGYSDMAIGIGRMLGFKFPENFNSPYTSVSITEFWRKWHITLGTFMRDYLYKPLGGNRNGTTSTYRNLFIVFLLSGLWHGASWNFVLWGAFHGFFLVVERLSGLSKSTRYGLLRVPITFLIVILGWVVFRIEDTGHAMAYYKTLFQFDGIMPIYLFRKKLVVTLIVAALFSFITLTPIGKRWADHFYREHFKGRSVHLYGVIALIIFIWSTGSLATGAFNPFIYFRF